MKWHYVLRGWEGDSDATVYSSHTSDTVYTISGNRFREFPTVPCSVFWLFSSGSLQDIYRQQHRQIIVFEGV